MKKLSCIFLAVIILSACNPIKGLLQGGQVKMTNSLEEIPFTFTYNMPIVKVTIDGKTYRFLFDTGAPSVLSKELAATLGLKAQTSGKTADSGDQTNREEFVVVPELKVGNLVYENIGAVVMDLKKVFEYRCLNFDGILGANQMAKTFWQIDYQKQLVIATDDFSKFGIDKQMKTIDFIPRKNQLTPLVPVKIGDKITYATFDTGSNGDFNLKISSFKSQIKGLKQATYTGFNIGGVYGSSQMAASVYAKIPNLSIGDVVLENQILRFGSQNSNTLGNHFLKNYKVFINWKTNKIHLKELARFDRSTLTGFGIGIKYSDEIATVASIFDDSAAARSGIMINDKIVSIDGLDMRDLSEQDACTYVFSSPLKGKSTSITVLRQGKTLTFNLNNVVLLD